MTSEEVENQELRRQINLRDKELQEKTFKIKSLENNQKDLMQSKSIVTKKYETQCEKNLLLVSATEKLESTVTKLNQEVLEKSLDSNKNKLLIEKLKEDIKVLEELRKQHENLILSKEKEMQEKEKSIDDLKRVLEAITKLTKSKV